MTRTLYTGRGSQASDGVRKASPCIPRLTIAEEELRAEPMKIQVKVDKTVDTMLKFMEETYKRKVEKCKTFPEAMRILETHFRKSNCASFWSRFPHIHHQKKKDACNIAEDEII